MNPENKTIEVYLEKEEANDYLVFEFEQVKKVCLNNENSQGDLLDVFNLLLENLVKEPISLQYRENPKYNEILYIDVCKEYIHDLNIEIGRVSRKIPETISVKVKQ